MKKKKILVIVGPTATGKSDLAVFLAKKISARGRPASGWNGGEIISADSRQAYKGLDIGTGKITKKEMGGVPHHLLDVTTPKRIFTVSEYKKLGEKALQNIWRQGKLPIICGGTGFYIQALVDGIILPEVPPNKKLRKQLEKKSTATLFLMLKKLDPRRAKEIDAKNPRRLVRAIEIAKYLGKVPHLEVQPPSNVGVLRIGIDMPDKILKERIEKRLLTRIKQGMIEEAKRLHREGISWKRMEELGLEYRYLAQYLQGKITKKQMTEGLEQAIWQYAKRQRTWFKRDKRITWFRPQQKKNIEKLVRRFL